ncbi:MAG TPA: hypothetical protein VMZ28_19650, partial [Kofleriaceae bacterium]|nr:hypothetical protein [Kofleriaceae bacterium]
KEPAARFSSMDELAGTLVAAKTAPRRAAPATALAPTRVTASPSLPGTIPRRRGPRIAVVTAVVLALAAAAFVLLRGPSAPPPVAPVPAIAPTPVEIPVSTPVAEPPVAPVAPAIVEPVRAKPAAKPPKPSLHHPPPVDPKGPETLDDSLL